MAPQRGMTPEDLFRIHWISDVQLSPDGTLAAFIVTQLDPDADEYRSAVWLVPTGGGPPRRLTYGPKRDTQPRFSPDGQTLAFIRDTSGKENKEARPQLWAIRLSGGEAWPLTAVPTGATHPVWSPDGRHLAFLSRVSPDDGVSPEEKEQRQGQARVIDRLKYKLNGEGFIYDRPYKLWVVPFAETGPQEAQRLTDGEWSDTFPAWSPDGRWLAFISTRHETWDLDNTSDIWVIPAVGGRPRKVTASQGPASAPCWSPDGKAIAYVGHRHPLGSGFNTKLWVIPARGGEPRDLTAEFDRTVVGPAVGTAPTVHWSKDGRSLLFPVLDRGCQHLYRVSAAGGHPELVVGGEREISSFAVASDSGDIAFIASTATDPAEVFFLSLKSGAERQITDVNAAWKAEVYRAAPERLRFQSADGTAIEGWLMKPFGFREGHTYPVLYNIHGGPHAQYGYTFFDEFQVQAGHGYGVFYTNPRGSQGYGEAFSIAITGEWGKLDYEDVMAGLDALLQVPWVDGERIGVLGGSYGGYLTSWIVGHTDRFKAACSERAVNNLSSMYGTSDIGFSFMEWEAGGKPFWEAPLHYLERSPIHYVQHVVTPTLIIHSENDLRCPIEQAEQFYIALKRRGVPTRFVRFPEENHDLSRSGKPSRRIQRFRLQLAWFDEYLKPQRPNTRPGSHQRARRRARGGR